MRAKKLLGALDPEEFNGLVEAYIDQVEPDTMSFEAFDHVVRRLGIYQFKVRRALEMYQAGAGSLGYVAEKVDLPKRDLIREARARGIEPPFDEQIVREELGA